MNQEPSTAARLERSFDAQPHGNDKFFQTEEQWNAWKRICDQGPRASEFPDAALTPAPVVQFVPADDTEGALMEGDLA